MQKKSFIYTVFSLLLVTATSALVSFSMTSYLVEKRLYQYTQDSITSLSQTSDAMSVSAALEEHVDWDQRVELFNREIESNQELATVHQELYDQRTAIYEEAEQYDDPNDIPEELLLEYERISALMLELLQSVQ